MRPLPSFPIGVTGGVRFRLEVEDCEIPLPSSLVCSDNCIGELGGVMLGMMEYEQMRNCSVGESNAGDKLVLKDQLTIADCRR